MHVLRSLCLLILIGVAVPSAAGQAPQRPPAPATAPASPSVAETTASDRREATNDQKDWHFIGHVEMDRDPQGASKIYADDVWLYMGQDKAIATGNVLLTQGANRS
jgi:lipopolysaccharide assembly outer membrane protein LptD (OstA)